MKKSNKFFGSILLVSGTTIGAAMLALPVTTGLAGFFPALAIMSVVWLLMIFTALYLLEVNVRLPGEPNIISMVKKTLNGPGTAVAWVAYLLLLYALIAAYMVGASQILSDFLTPYISFEFPSYFFPIAIFVLFSIFIYFGTQMADIFNRIMMLLLLFAYVAMIVPGVTHIKMAHLTHYNWHFLLPSLSVVATTFGYHIIIPTLTTYLEHDVKLVKRAIIIGSILPFIIYALWLLIVMGVVPLEYLTKASFNGDLPSFYLNQVVHSPILRYATSFFALFAIITSLIGVSLSLSDFLADGLRIKKNVKGKGLVVLLTFLPPLLFTLFYPAGFIIALRYAGIFVVILLAILPTLMALVERYGPSTARSLLPSQYRVCGGRSMLVAAALLSFILLIIEVLF